jgi:glycine/D-amino acid oxidase-like deaminating enzyme
MEHVDVVVIGGGLCGVSVAHALATQGVGSVMLLEQGESLGAEASAQNAGMVRRLALDPVERELACRSAAAMERPEFAGALRRTGAVLAAGHDPAPLAAAVADLQSRGISADRLHLDRLPPALAGSPLQAAWTLPQETVADAWGLISVLAREARGSGARLQTGRCVQGVATHAGRAVGVHTDTGPVRADVVVLATAAWAHQQVRALGLSRPLVPLARHLLLTTPHPASSPDHPWCWVDDEGVYARPESGGWLCSPCDEVPRAPGGGPGSRGPAEPLGYALVQDALERWFPALGPVGFLHGWTGLRTFCPDRRPLVGLDPDLPGLAWATAFGGFGVTCSLAVGPLVADLLAGRPDPVLDLATLAPGRSFPSWAQLPTGSRDWWSKHGAVPSPPTLPSQPVRGV